MSLSLQDFENPVQENNILVEDFGNLLQWQNLFFPKKEVVITEL